MNLDPVQVMKGQSNPKDPTAAPVTASSNGDGKGGWVEKEEFDQDHLGLTTKPLLVSSVCQSVSQSVFPLLLFSASVPVLLILSIWCHCLSVFHMAM